MAKYSKGAQKGVESAMKRMEKGKLRSGKSNKKVTNPKQAIAIGLSEAREKGAKVPAKKISTKKVPEKKTAAAKTAKKTASKKAAEKKAVPQKAAKSVKPEKAVSKKLTPVKATAPVVNKKNTTKNSNQSPEKTMVPLQEGTINKTVNTINQTGEQQPAVKDPAIPAVKNEGPMMAVDKKLVARITTKIDPKHHMQISSTAKNGFKPAGKKPLWNR